MDRTLSLRIKGFVLSLILTLVAYFIIVQPGTFNFDIKTASLSILALAFIQSIVQLIFFINIWEEEGPLWNLGIFMSTIPIIFIVIFFSIWIINHLNYNMH